MSDSIQDEKVAYIAPAETKWCVSIRDGTGLSEGLFTVRSRNYYDTVEGAKEAADRRLDSGAVDRVEENVVAQRFLAE
jgi:hypothetical protein